MNVNRLAYVRQSEAEITQASLLNNMKQKEKTLLETENYIKTKKKFNDTGLNNFEKV